MPASRREPPPGANRATRPRLPFGVPEVDSRIHGGLAFGSTHEVAGGGSDTVNGATAASFTAGIAARTKGPVFGCLVKDDLFAPALTQAGLDVNRVTFVQSADEDGVMESAEEILNHGGTAVMVAELVRLPMVASRRLQLAAEKTGTMGLIIRRWRRQTEATDYGQPSSSATRWRVSTLPSEPLPVQGVGRPRWCLELMRARAGESFDIAVAGCDTKGRLEAVLQRSDFQWRTA
ncbi:MAG: ImuA family protein [Shinella sp.]|uniref:ImuA family protein n=1 Tax=Shinella sp. TaxID=1870904 RepID=UPI004037196A